MPTWDMHEHHFDKPTTDHDRKGLSPTASRRASALAVRRSWLEPDVLVDYRFHATR